MRVIGTAGHVDHGKSTLVLALTGIDPDRLAEEKAREMTIDLGFAWLTLPDGQAVGVVDVPGHIDFIKNMLAGIGGIDAALLVIAADEGVMPQTQEHLAILDLLEVPGGVVALTKIDMVQHDPEWLELVQVDVEDTLVGTGLEGSEIIPVSARTGQGLEALTEALVRVLADVPERRDVGRPRLAIDRVFTVSGFGTIVTGTLSDGILSVGQEVEIVPTGLTARVRGLQTHKQKIDQAVPGSRVAVNLTGVSKEQINRGDVVTMPGTVGPTILVDVHVRMVSDSPWPLEHNQLVNFFSGAAEVPARTRLLDSEAIQAGGTGWIQLRLSEPVALQRGDRFILRLPSPSRTLGGGVVVNPYPGRRWRRFRPEVVQMLQAYYSGDPVRIFQQELLRREPASLSQVANASNLNATEGLKALETLVEAGAVEILDADWQRQRDDDDDRTTVRPGLQHLVSSEGWQKIKARITNTLQKYHRQYPLRMAMPREELKSKVQSRRGHGWSLSLFNDIVARATAQNLIAETGSTVRLRDHQASLTPKQQTAVSQLLQSFERNPLSPPSVAESVAATGEDVFLWLVDSGQLIRVSGDVVFSAEGYGKMVEAILEHLQSEGSITVAQVRDLLGTSRKYALGLMEYLDSQRVTRRVGDTRVLR
ncbi:MAG: selenocysteine-specific translation elongation factor [Chloroflexota bacterium]|nr:selenocysteine-specific translation elongation factor [Chloroflexota bacterium]